LHIRKSFAQHETAKSIPFFNREEHDTLWRYRKRVGGVLLLESVGRHVRQVSNGRKQDNTAVIDAGLWEACLKIRDLYKSAAKKLRQSSVLAIFTYTG
jgi:hypothetical protein